MDHAIIIRLKYNDSPEFEWRLAFFASMCLPRYKDQTDQDFDIIILCNPIHDKRIKDLWPGRIKTIHAEVPISGDLGYNRNSGESNSVEPFPYDLDYKIQTRVDSDDIVSLDFAECIHAYFKNETKLTLLAFKPMRFNVHNLRIYHIYPKDNAYRKSQFLSLFNPKKDTFIYERGHRTWDTVVRQKGGQTKIVKFGYCYVSYHYYNASTKIQPTDVMV